MKDDLCSTHETTHVATEAQHSHNDFCEEERGEFSHFLLLKQLYLANADTHWARC